MVEGKAKHNPKPTISAMLTEKEYKLIRYCRDLGYGKFELWIKDGQPVRAEVPKQSIEF
jgi:hypothetical protein